MKPNNVICHVTFERETTVLRCPKASEGPVTIPAGTWPIVINPGYRDIPSTLSIEAPNAKLWVYRGQVAVALARGERLHGGLVDGNELALLMIQGCY